MKRGFHVTYRKVTPDDSGEGNHEDENGYYGAGGWYWPVDNLDLATPEGKAEYDAARESSFYGCDPEDGEEETAIDLAARFLRHSGACEVETAGPVRPGGWFVGATSEDYRDGTSTTLSFHPVGFSAEELAEMGRKVWTRRQ